jgi:hypothetical protein
MADFGKVLPRSDREVVENADARPRLALQEADHETRPEKTATARDQNRSHRTLHLKQ